MPLKAARDLAPGDSVFTDDRERAKIVEIRQSKTEVKSKAGKYGDALMILHRPVSAPENYHPLDCSFVHPDDRVEYP